ncbi:MAG: hypothetical protein KAR38_17000, partial [Calditrichia bacterium]|nr:hypothetical protein [Calditrichia bacterium]
EWYDRRFSGTSGSLEIDFSLPQAPAAFTNARVAVSLKGGYGSFYTERSSCNYEFDISINSTKILDNIFISKNNFKTATTNIPSALLSTSNSCDVSYSSSYSHAYAYFDYLDIQYYTENNLSGNYLKLFSPTESGNFAYNISTTSDINNLLLLKISDPFNPEEIIPESAGNRITFIENNSNNIPDEFLLVNYSNIETPVSVTSIVNESNLRDSQIAADLIIITSEDFLNEAEQLKSLKETDYPQYERLETEIVTTQRIYREFSSGQLSPVAIRNFIKYSVNNWATAPQYIIFLGDGHFDYKGIIYPNYNIVPPYEFEHIGEIWSRAIEAFFTDINFDGGFNSLNPDIPLGRINVETNLEFEHYYQKILHYMESYLYSTNYTGWQQELTLVADDQFGDSNSQYEKVHVVDSERLISGSSISDIMNVKKIYLTDYERAPGGIG